MNQSDSFSKFDDDKTVYRPMPGGRIRLKPLIPSEDPYSDDQFDEYQHRTAATESTNLLITSSFSLLSLVPKLRNLPFLQTINELREKLIEEIKSFEDQALKKGVSPNQVDTAKYFLCSLIDEAVLNTPWGSESGWGHNSLSSHFFRKMLGGEEFFSNIDRLKQRPAENLNLLELAYLCLSLGFEGKYRFTSNGLSALDKERQELYLLIQRIRGDAQPELSIHWQGAQNFRNRVTRRVPLWVFSAVVALSIFMVFLGFTYSIEKKSDQVYGKLARIAENVKKKVPIQFSRARQKPDLSFAIADSLRRLMADEIRQGKIEIDDGPVLRIFDSFVPGSAELKKDYQDILRRIVSNLKELQKNFSFDMEVFGYTDNQKLKFGSRFKSNWELSNWRAESAANILRANPSLEKHLINVKGRGVSNLASNNTKEGRRHNRRIDIEFKVW